MYTYEAMFILKPTLSEEGQSNLVVQIEKLLKDNQAAISSSQSLGRRRLAYSIKKCDEGLYHLINFSCPASEVVQKLKTPTSINENILRVLVVKKKNVAQVA